MPIKSACFFCPGSKRQEIVQLPSVYQRQSLTLEERFQTGKHSHKITSTKGLGRNRAWADILKAS